MSFFFKMLETIQWESNNFFDIIIVENLANLGHYNKKQKTKTNVMFRRSSVHKTFVLSTLISVATGGKAAKD